MQTRATARPEYSAIQTCLTTQALFGIAPQQGTRTCCACEAGVGRGAAVRSLVPDKGGPAIALRGDLGAILRFAAGKQNPDFRAKAEALDNLLSPGSLVAGAGFEPAAFRL